MILDQGPCDAVAKDLAQADDEVLCRHCAVLVLVLGIAEGTVDEKLYEAAELFLAETFI